MKEEIWSVRKGRDSKEGVKEKSEIQKWKRAAETEGENLGDKWREKERK